MQKIVCHRGACVDAASEELKALTGLKWTIEDEIEWNLINREMQTKG